MISAIMAISSMASCTWSCSPKSQKSVHISNTTLELEHTGASLISSQNLFSFLVPSSSWPAKAVSPTMLAASSAMMTAFALFDSMRDDVKKRYGD